MTLAPRFRVLFFVATMAFLQLRGSAWALESVPARDAFLKLIDKPRVDPKVDLGEPEEADGFKTAHFSFTSEGEERVPGIVVYAANAGGKMPAVIVMHGTGGKKEGEIPLMKKLAERGCVAVAIDGRFHGERVKDSKGTELYNEAILKKFKGEAKGFPLYWDTVFDAMRLIDILSAHDGIDAERIGVIGFSKGGIETYFLAAADPRVAVAVPCIGVQSFKWGLDNEAWRGRVDTVKVAFEAAAKSAGVAKPDAAFARTFMDKVVPGIYGDYDGPAMLPLIAPRPLLVINGDSDVHTPLMGVTLTMEKTKAAYVAAKAEDKLKQIVEAKTAHKVTAEAEKEAIDFLAKHLGL